METLFLKDGAVIDYDLNFLSKKECDKLYEELLLLNVERPSIKMYGKMVPLPRYQSWMADSGITLNDVYIDQNGFEQMDIAWQHCAAIGIMPPRLFEVISER